VRSILCSVCFLFIGCTMARDRFPGSFRSGALNDTHEDLYDRAIPRFTPSAAAEVPSLPPPPAEVPPLPRAEVPPLPAAGPAEVPPLPTAAAAVPPPPAPRRKDPEPEIPALSASPSPVLLSRWLRHGEPAEMRRTRIAAFAASLLGLRKVIVQGRRFASNCSDFVRAVYSIEGIDLYHWPTRPRGFGGVRSLYALAKSSGGLHFSRSPRAGDLVYFHHTYDFNRNQKVDDYLSHVGVVEKVDGDGTVHYIDYSARRVRRNQMNLRRPHHWKDPQTLKRLNSYVRGRKRTDPAGTEYLAGELFAGFGTLLR
jgi:hypothetical protein